MPELKEIGRVSMKGQHLIYLFLLVIVITLSGCDTFNSVRMMQINSNVKPQVNRPEPIKLDAKFIGEKPMCMR